MRKTITKRGVTYVVEVNRDSMSVTLDEDAVRHDDEVGCAIVTLPREVIEIIVSMYGDN